MQQKQKQKLTFDGKLNDASGSNCVSFVPPLSSPATDNSSSDSSSDRIGACTNLRLPDDVCPVSVVFSVAVGRTGGRALRLFGLGGSFAGFGTAGVGFCCVCCSANCLSSATV
ncbi:unnamed protein product [Phytophthora lilii]|uniref:Unnamed protein product n=1 Tax=Phytophthora lilii TaxID=2077276 RepID=A0A9W6TRU3_9STRA|nr:unnamed protein product [Phytophthora lilii]